jgi:hypothetical protein
MSEFTRRGSWGTDWRPHRCRPKTLHSKKYSVALKEPKSWDFWVEHSRKGGEPGVISQEAIYEIVWSGPIEEQIQGAKRTVLLARWSQCMIESFLRNGRAIQSCVLCLRMSEEGLHTLDCYC